MNIRGGIARRNGVTFFSDRFVVTAIRQKDGHINLHTKELLKKNRSLLNNLDDILSSIPFIRGIWAYILVLLQNWKLPLVMGLLWVALSLLINSPTFYDEKGSKPYPLWLIFTFTLIALIKFTSLGKYHAAEHQVANAYMQIGDVSLQSVKDASRIHRQCGTNLVVFAMAIALSIIILFDVNVSLAGLIGLSVGTEIHFNRNKAFERLLHPFYILGALLQLFAFTSKSNDGHLEVAIAALNELKKVQIE